MRKPTASSIDEAIARWVEAGLVESTDWHGDALLATPLPKVDGLWFDEAAVVRVLEFFKLLKQLVGRWAGHEFVLLDWQVRHLIAPVFGFKGRDGRRIIRTVWFEICRKNGLQWSPAPKGRGTQELRRQQRRRRTRRSRCRNGARPRRAGGPWPHESHPRRGARAPQWSPAPKGRGTVYVATTLKQVPRSRNGARPRRAGGRERGSVGTVTDLWPQWSPAPKGRGTSRSARKPTATSSCRNGARPRRAGGHRDRPITGMAS